MYIARSLLTLQDGSEADLVTEVEMAHASRRGAVGFRWAMLLRSFDAAANYASVSMWLTPEHEQAWREANDAPAPMHRYDITTARGAMTPASAVALVEWQVDEALAARFTQRWNAAYHAIEDVFGSRLLQDLDSPGSYAGLHAVTDPARLDIKVLSADVTDDEGLDITPAVVDRFDVVLLTEAD